MYPSNAPYMPHMPITSCTDIRKLQEYIYLIGNHAINNVTRSTGTYTFQITVIDP